MANNENRYQHSAKGNGGEVHTSARSKGISDCRTGRCPPNGMAEGYYAGYSEEYERQACLDNQTKVAQ